MKRERERERDRDYLFCFLLVSPLNFSPQTADKIFPSFSSNNILTSPPTRKHDARFLFSQKEKNNVRDIENDADETFDGIIYARGFFCCQR